MNPYKKYILPRLIDNACSVDSVERQRKKVVPLARGKVLEIGMGTGLNLPHYDATQVDSIVGIEPALDMHAMAQERIEACAIDVEIMGVSAESIPLPTDTFDTILLTYTLCSIPNAHLSLREMNRVLKPTGQLIFCEHGYAPDRNIQRIQNALTPLWRYIAGGCHLNRDIPKLIEQANFTITALDTLYLPGYRATTFNYWGTASPTA